MQYLTLSYSPLRNSEGVADRVLGIGAFVTNEVNARLAIEAAAAEVERQRAEFFAVFADAPFSLGIYRGEDLVLEFANQAGLDFVGRGSEIIGQPLLAAFPEVGDQGFVELMRSVLATGEPLRVDESPLRLAPAMDLQYVSLIYYPLRNISGVIDGVIAAVLPVTELVRARQERDAAAAVKSEFLGLVSHELRTPLTVVRGNAAVLARQPHLPDEMKAVVDDLYTEAERLSRIVDNMFVLARLDAGQTLPTEPVLLAEAVEQAVRRFNGKVHGGPVSVLSLSRGTVVLGVDEYIQQILHNLLSNAYKYSPPGSPITISVSALTTEAVVSVTDRGRGIEKPDEVFQAFNRGKVASEIAPGLGLGLAVCKALVEAMKGEIRVEAREGGGSVLSFALPLVTSEP